MISQYLTVFSYIIDQSTIIYSMFIGSTSKTVCLLVSIINIYNYKGRHALKYQCMPAFSSYSVFQCFSDTVFRVEEQSSEDDTDYQTQQQINDQRQIADTV